MTECKKCGKDSKGRDLCIDCWKAERDANKPAPKKEVDWDAKDRRISRLSALDTAIEIVKVSVGAKREVFQKDEETTARVIDVARLLEKYVYE